MSSLKGPPWPSFPTEWTAPTSCFATTNYYRVLLGSGFFSNMYGTPTPVLTGIYPTGDCWPPSSTVNVPYQTDGGCPVGFTRACATGGLITLNGKPVSTVTCCPSVTDNVFSFMCRDNEYGCHATATPGVVWTGVITDISLETPTEEPVTRRPNTAEGIEAWGIKMISVAPATDSSRSSATSASSTATNTSNTGNGGQNNNETAVATPSSGLSTGATIGIAVGAVLVGAAILAAAGFFLWRRHQRKKHNLQELDSSATALATMNHQQQYYPKYGGGPGPDESGAYSDAAPKPEVEGTVYHQLDSTNAPQMLDSRETRPGRDGYRPAWELQG